MLRLSSVSNQLMRRGSAIKSELAELSRSMHPKLILKHVLISFIFLASYLLLSRPEVIFIARLGFTAWYPATGLVIALTLGISPWYAALAGVADALSGLLIYHQPLTSYSEISAVPTAIAYGAAAYLLRKKFKIDRHFSYVQHVVLYVFVTMAAAAVSTGFGVASLALDKSIQWSEFWSSASGWFLGDEIGILGIAPFFLVHGFVWINRSKELHKPRYEVPARQNSGSHVSAWLEDIAQGISVLVVVWLLFGPIHAPMYLSFLPIIWIAMRQGVGRATSALLVLIFAVVCAMHVYPPSPDFLQRASLLMLVLSAVGLIVSSSVTERQRIGTELSERTVYLNSLIENSPIAIVVRGRKGEVELTNAAFRELFGYNEQQLAGCDLDRMLCEGESAGKFVSFTPVVLKGKAVHELVKRKRRDGQILDVELHAVPLIVNGQVRGAFTLYEDVSERIQAAQAERRHAESLKQLVEELQLRTKQMTVLNEMGSLLECCGTVPEACAVVSQSMQKLLPAALSGTLFLYQSSPNQVEAAVSWGGTSPSEPIFAPDLCWALRRGHAHWTKAGEPIPCSHMKAATGSGTLCMPMVADGKKLGILLLEFADSWEQPNSGWQAVLEMAEQLAATAANQIALSLSSLRLRENLRQQAIRDPLTGLFNRRAMMESVERELQRANRKQQPVSVLMVDIDHFKQFNDTYGHNAGDWVLRAVADLFRSFFRADDIVCRYGGEEFVITLPEASAQASVARANQLRERAQAMKLEYGKQGLGNITISIGIATFPQDGRSVDELLKVADKCLYESKRRGRNMVTVLGQNQPGSLAVLRN